MKIATTHELMAALSRSVQHMSRAEKTEVRDELNRRLTPLKIPGESMKHDLDTLALNDYDRAFLHDLKIAIPDDTRWEIDGDATSASDSGPAE